MRPAWFRRHRKLIMKRSRSIRLALVSTLPFALTACDTQDPVKTITATKTFESMKECVDSKVPTDVCSNSFIQALNEHKRIAPMYENKADCENDFMEGFCNTTSDGKWMPALSGFQITSTAEVPASQLQGSAPNTAGGTTVVNNGGGGSGMGDILTGVLIGNMISGMMNTPRYQSEPVYGSRNSRGDFSKSTISDRVKSGSTFGSSIQSKSGFDYKKKSLTRSLENRSIKSNRDSSVKSSTARGGFGSQATARGGFGGG